MDALEIIDEWKGKPKGLDETLVAEAKADPLFALQLAKGLSKGSRTARGACATALAHLARDEPSKVAPLFGRIRRHVGSDIPRVKWGASEAAGHIAETHPEKAVSALPLLLANTGDDSTVVRWCAAFGISEIAKGSSRARKKLVPVMKRLAAREKNNGVKKVYLQTLKAVEEGGWVAFAD